MQLLLPTCNTVTNGLHKFGYTVIMGGIKFHAWSKLSGRHSGLMVSELDSGSSGPGSSPGRGHCVVFLGKTLNSHSASLHPGV